MAVSFTPKERHGIVNALREAARKNAASVGMRKTTVDELAEEAGISKGAFYKFYQSKEHLFLDMLEQWYQQIYEGTAQALAAQEDLPPRKRAALALKTAWRIMIQQPLMRFCRDDIPLMTRKLPEAVLSEHYRSVDEFIGELIDSSRVMLTVSKPDACAAVKILFYSLLIAPDVGDHFERAMDELVEGACAQMVREENPVPQGT